MKKTSFLALLGKKFPENLSRLSVKGGGVPPLSAKEKNLLFSHWFSVEGVGGGYPLNGKNPLKRKWQLPLLTLQFSWTLFFRLQAFDLTVPPLLHFDHQVFVHLCTNFVHIVQKYFALMHAWQKFGSLPLWGSTTSWNWCRPNTRNIGYWGFVLTWNIG